MHVKTEIHTRTLPYPDRVDLLLGYVCESVLKKPKQDKESE